MNKNVILRIFISFTAILAIVSCDDDFNSVGSEVIGDVGFEENVYQSSPIVYNQQLERVQTNRLPNNLLGFYKDPVYGNSEYAILSQMTPLTLDPVFGKNPVVDSVVISLPYFSNVLSTEVEGDVTIRTYELDSVYGNTELNLQLFRSDFFLRDFDPTSNFEEPQIYYSNDISSFDQMAVQNTPIATISSFIPSAEELVLPIRNANGLKSEVDVEKDSIIEVQRVSPRLRFKLPNELFKELILDQEGQTTLSNVNNFNDYFRGLYIKPELITPENGNLFAFDILNNNANITMFYSFDTDNVDEEDVDKDGDVTEFLRGQRTYVIRFSRQGTNNQPIPLNTINEIDTDFTITIPESDPVNGDESLYLKGGVGSYAILNLFDKYVQTDDNGAYILDENGGPIFKETPANPSDTDKTELDFVRDQNWLINNAELKLYIDREKMTAGGATEPERIYIFSAETGQPLVDFCFEIASNPTTDPSVAASIHLGSLERGSDGLGEFYEINLTRHIISLLNENTDVTKLGIAVSQNVLAQINTQTCTSSVLTGNEDLTVPPTSVLSPEGTIIYGNTEEVPEDKRLLLELNYSGSTRN